MNLEDQIAAIRRHQYVSFERRQQAIDTLRRLEKQEQLPKEEILALAKKIRPLVRGTQNNTALKPENMTGRLYWANAPHIATDCFTSGENHAIKRAKGIWEVGRVTTYHIDKGDYYPSYPYPTVAEAITQCPKQWLDKVIAFEFQLDSFDYSKIYDELLNRHVLRTIYYTGTLPEDIANRPVEW